MQKQKIIFMFSFLLFFTILLAACNKEENKNTKKISTVTTLDSKESYLYQSSFETLNIKVSSISNVCNKENDIYMIGYSISDSNISQYFLITYHLKEKSAVQKKLSIEKKEVIHCLAIGKENKLFLLTSIRKNKYMHYYIKTLEQDGKIINSQELLRKKKSSYFSAGNNKTIITEDKMIYTIRNHKIYAFDWNGKEKASLHFKGFPYGIFQTNGNIYIYGYSKEKREYILKKWNTKANTLSKKISLHTSYPLYNPTIYANGKNSIYIKDEDNVYSYNLTNNETKLLFTWLEQDVDKTTIKAFLPIKDSIFVISIANNSNNIEINAINKIKESEKKKQKILTLACDVLVDNIREAIFTFNKTNKNYRIEAQEYSSEALSLKLISGQIPDIICSVSLPINQYIKKGLLTDLYPLMETDAEINKEDFIDSIRKTIEIDNKLYYMGIDFIVEGLAGGKKTLKGKDYLDFKELQNLYKMVPKNGTLIKMSRQYFLNQSLYYQMETYIDWKTKTVSFETENFIQLLKLLKNFPDESEVDYEDYEVSSHLSIRDGEVFLENFYLSRISDIQKYIKLFQKEGGCCIVSYPNTTQNDKLAMVFDTSQLAITEQCMDKQGAWKFLRQFFTYEYQIQGGNDTFGIPIRKDALEQKLQYAMAKSSYTKDGISIKPVQDSFRDGEYLIETGALNKKETVMVQTIINRIGMIKSSYNTISQQIQTIVSEEAAAFFAGDKTAEEVAKIVQNRVNIYVNENL